MGEEQSQGLAAIEQAAKTAGRGPPPVHLWNPAHCGAIDIRIAADGQWFHEGSPIGRAPLVRLFASVLRLDPEGYVLVTPVEKLSIVVDDAPFVAVAVEAGEDRLIFTTNVGDRVVLDGEHGLCVRGGVPYLHVRRGLEAKVARTVWYQLADIAVPCGGEMGVWSGGQFFALGPA